MNNETKGAVHERASRDSSCCAVDAVVTVDERGQMVLPKDVRKKAGIGAGEKLAVVTMNKDGRVCCISLIKVDEMADLVQKLIQPLAGVVTK